MDIYNLRIVVEALDDTGDYKFMATSAVLGWILHCCASATERSTNCKIRLNEALALIYLT